ncbi:MAG: hypothetical protein HKN29_08120 [Rhodothermales bacterium]|nr:hypothetical protein [Rhodothermales bacterium]
MIRVLFIILAVVSMALAFVLSISWLYLVSAGMLVTAAVILTLDTKKRLRRSAVAGSKPVVVEQAEEDLKSFGIMEIRPKSKSGMSTMDAGTETPVAEQSTSPAADKSDASAAPPRTPATAKAKADTGGGAPAPAGRTRTESLSRSTGSSRDRARISGVGVVRKRARTAKIMVEGVSDELRGEVMLSVLRGLRSAVAATTVTLLKQESGPLGYTVEAMVSQNSFARSGGRFTVAEPFLSGGAPLTPSIIRCHGTNGFNARRLGYYHEPIAINKLALVPLNTASGLYLLACDSMSPEAFEDGDTAGLLSEFARLVQTLVQGAPVAEPEEAEVVIRPRREIIAEEIVSARQAESPLALALVHLNGADDLDDIERVAAEGVMAHRLSESAAEARVERFGELTYGVLQKTTADDAARWASSLLQHFRDKPGSLSGGLSVGVAMLSDRHQGADALRADATAALRESYETGECIILE